MSNLISAQFAGGPTINESLEKRNEDAAANEAYESDVRKYENNPNLAKKSNEWAAEAMGGIGELDPESSVQRAQEAQAAEIGDEINNGTEFDLDAALENIDTGITPNIEELALENGETVNEETEIVKEKIAQKSEYAPIIVKFVQHNNIKENVGKELIEQGINAENYHEIIKNSNAEDTQKTALIESLDYLSSGNTTKLAESEMQTSFPEVFGDYNNINPEEQSPHALTAYREITEHYIPSEQAENREANLSLAIDMAANTLGDKAKLNLDLSNTVLYEDAIKTAHSSETAIEDRFRALKTISEIIGTDQGAKGFKTRTDERIAQNKFAQNAKQNEAFQTAQAQLGNDKTSQKTQDTVQMATDIPKQGDVEIFGGGENDRAGGSKEDTQIT